LEAEMTTFVAQHPRTATTTKAPATRRFARGLSAASASLFRGHRSVQNHRAHRLIATDPFVIMSFGRD
jgi:hypothetical protein